MVMMRLAARCKGCKKPLSQDKEARTGMCGQHLLRWRHIAPLCGSCHKTGPDALGSSC